MNRLVSLCWFLLVFAGCTMNGPIDYAFKPHMTASQKQYDYDLCKIASLKEIPQNMVTRISGGDFDPGDLRCIGVGSANAYCQRIGAFQTPVTSMTYDENGGLRARFIQACMRHKGYDLVKVSRCTNVADDIKSATAKNSADVVCAPKHLMLAPD